jgi:hypothetical protein
MSLKTDGFCIPSPVTDTANWRKSRPFHDQGRTESIYGIICFGFRNEKGEVMERLNIDELLTQLEQSGALDNQRTFFTRQPRTSQFIDLEGSNRSVQDLLDDLTDDEIDTVFQDEQVTSNSLGQGTVAWYVPYHTNQRRWGIYLDLDRLQHYANVVYRELVGSRHLKRGVESKRLVLELVVASVVEHEKYHHRIENIISQFELALKQPIYTKAVLSDLSKRLPLHHARIPAGSADELEEALANGARLRPNYLRGKTARLSEPLISAFIEILKKLDENLKGGYELGHLYEKGDCLEQENALIDTFISAAQRDTSPFNRVKNFPRFRFGATGIEKRVFPINGRGTLTDLSKRLQALNDELNGVKTEDQFAELIRRELRQQGADYGDAESFLVEKGFIKSFQAVSESRRSKTLRLCVKVVRFKNDSRKVDGYKFSIGGKKFKNVDGRTAYHWDVENKTPQSARLYGWFGSTNPSVIFLCVLKHDAKSPF